MYYVGLDIHQRSTNVEILDCNGKLVKRGESELKRRIKRPKPKVKASGINCQTSWPATAAKVSGGMKVPTTSL